MISRYFSRWLPGRSLRVPLRTALVVPFVLQISVAVGLTGYFSIRNGQRAVNDVASQFRNEVTARIQQHVANYMAVPQLVTQVNANAVASGELDLENTTSLEKRLWNQMQTFESLRPIAFGSAQGEIHSVDRLQNTGELVIRVIDESTSGSYHTYSTNQQGDRVALISVSKTFDPRLRPWYQEAVRAGQATWSEIYPYFSSWGLAISATQPLYDAQTQTLLGVTNATLSLSQISDFLSQLNIGKSGQTFIIERSGNLVASSTTEAPLIATRQGNLQTRRRLAALNSRDRITRLTTLHLLKHFGNLQKIDHNQQLSFKLDGHRQFVQVAPFSDSYGLDWLIVVVVPEAEFMEYIAANTRLTILLCLGALLLATVMGALTADWIARPILRLSSASQSFAQATTANSGKVDPKANLIFEANSINELRVLAQAYNQMATQLRTAFAALEQVNVDLELRVEQRTAELQELTLELRQASAFEAVLKRITDKVRDSLDETQILQTVVQELGDVLLAECCSAALYNLESQTIVIDYEYCKPNWPHTLGVVIPVEAVWGVHQSLLQGQCLQFCQRMPGFGRPHAAILACPIFDNQKMLADLWLFRESTRTYSDLEIRLVQQVANQCAIAIRQARLYQAAQAQVEELKNLNRLKDDFLSTVSHELRTPISNMKLAIHMLKLAVTPERHQQYLAILQAECARESEMINDLLDLQRLEADRYPIAAETIVLQDWLPEVIEPFQSRTQDRQQTLQVEIPADLPPLTSDRNSLGRLLAELLNNACKYTPSNGSIHFSIQPAGYSVLSQTTPVTQFQVKNEAEIPLAEVPRIFDKFYRIPNADPWKQGGTGLGLALVKKLVEQLEGTIQIESAAGWTTFTILLPNLEAESSETEISC